MATVISLKPQGENNSSVCFLTQTMGILYATMYGGRKSRLKSLVSPWNTGIVYFSEDPKTSFLKINDFDVKKYHLSFRENLVKYYASSVAAELALKTKCAGSPQECWALTNGFIDGLELCSTDDQCRLGLIRFLWRYLELLGIQPDASSCSICEKSFLSGKNGIHNVLYNELKAEFLVGDNQFICSECRTESNKPLFYLNEEAIQYLAALTLLTPKDARAFSLSKESFSQLKELVFYLIENAIGTKLNSLQTGLGLL